MVFQSTRWGACNAPRTALAGAMVAALVLHGCSDDGGDHVVSARQAATTRVVLPVINSAMKTRLRAIYLNGQTLGNRANVFSKVGDSITTSRNFLTTIGCGAEVLDTYSSLAPTVSYFRGTTLTGRSAATCSTVNSFTLTSLAAGSKWTTTNVNARISNSSCPSPNNTNLRCEYRVTRPSISLIELGTYDLESSASASTFQTALTNIVTDTINAGVIPVLSTIPPRTDSTTRASRVAAYNDAIIAVATAQQVPLWDYWVAMTAPGMINQGLSTDKILPSVYGSTPATFTSAALAYGFNQRNLTALQVLEHVKAVVIDNGTPDPDGTDAGTDATTDTATDTAADTVDATTDTADAAADTVDATADTADAAADTADATADTADATADTTTDTAADTTTTDGGTSTRSVIPVINASMKTRLQTILSAGLAAGNRASVFSKIGDSITVSGSFLTDIGCSSENLGTYTSLATPITYFRSTLITPSRAAVWCGISNSFSLSSASADSGWTTASVLAPTSRTDCPAPNNSNMLCEYYLTRPAFALIMLGTNDLERINNVTTYTDNLTTIVTQTINRGIIPVLSTIPPRFDNATLGARVAAYNDAVMSVARANNIPLWDYWYALQAPTLINQGMDPDGIHPSVYLGQYACNFTTAGLQYGYNVRNLTAVQTLEHLKAIVIDNGAPDPDTVTTDAGTDVTTDSATEAATDAATDTADSTIDSATDAATDTADAATDIVDSGTDGAVACGTPLVDPTVESALATQRQSCAFTTGARVADTLGVTATVRSRIPVDHVVILMQENRSFDHYLGTMAGVDGIPAGYTNTSSTGVVSSPTLRTNTCELYDPPHQWAAMHTGWNSGAMDGFVRAGEVGSVPASFMLGYYGASTLPFYRWLYGRFAMSDRYFGSVLGGTDANRNFLYMGSSYGVHDTNEAVIDTRPTIFGALDTAGVSWGVYTDGAPRQSCIGWTAPHRGLYGSAQFFSQLAAGTLPSVVFLDPGPGQDEHPPANVQQGEAWARTIVTSAMASPLWSRIALLMTYDESGGFFDHAAPPSTCYPHAPGTVTYDTTDLNRLGIRVPLVVVSPWARANYVSHVAHDHTSALRFVETLFDIPALTARDANASALLDMFDFSCAQNMTIGETIPASGTGGCI